METATEHKIHLKDIPGILNEVTLSQVNIPLKAHNSLLTLPVFSALRKATAFFVLFESQIKPQPHHTTCFSISRDGLATLTPSRAPKIPLSDFTGGKLCGVWGLQFSPEEEESHTAASPDMLPAQETTQLLVQEKEQNPALHIPQYIERHTQNKQLQELCGSFSDPFKRY